MIEIFKTNLKPRRAGPVIKMLAKSFPLHKINFDPEDRDKILRVEGEKISAGKIINVIENEGFQCTILDH